MKKLLLITAILLAAATSVLAQTTVKGVVVDKKGEPVPGLTVIVEGTSKGTSTDMDGNYTISANPKDVLIFSAIGYEDVRETVGNRGTINVTVSESSLFIEETVVIGYGSVRKKDLTGSVASVKSDALENRVLLSVDDALAGGVSGLMVSSASGKPGSESVMLIRGASSLTGSTNPLIVIDGFPMFDVSTSSGGGLDATDGGLSSLSMVNTDDIASIEVLKDASATAIYGNRGANGVIIITTKKGNQKGGRISYSSYYGAQQIIKKYDVMDFDQYAEFQATRNTSNDLFYDNVEKVARNVHGIKTRDWQDEIFRTGFIQNQSLSISQANEKSNFLVSGSWLKNPSIIRNTDWNKFTGKIAVDYNFTKRIKVGSDINISSITDRGVATGGSGTGRTAGIITETLLAKPYDIFDPDTQAYFRRAGVKEATIQSYLNDAGRNPLTTVTDTQKEKMYSRARANAYLEAGILDNLILKVTGGYDIYVMKDRQYYPTTTGRGDFYDGEAIIGTRTSTSWINENTLTWTPVIGDHHFSVLGGVSEQGVVNYYDSSTTTQFDYEALGFNNVHLGKVFEAWSSKGRTTFLSFIARANYTYKDKYVATLTGRRDGTSSFVKNKWGNFFSGALAWNIDSEEFMKNQNTISTLKLRLSVGQVGNSGVPTSGSYAQLNDDKYSFNDGIAIGQHTASLANEGLSWETTTEENIGLELGLWNGRLSFTADLYNKVTDGLLLESPIINVTGYDRAWQNVGKLSNRGFEVMANAMIVDKPNFKWKFSGNFTLNKTKILELGSDGQPIYLTARCIGGANPVIMQVGGGIGDFYGYQVDGLYQLEDFDITELPNGDLSYTLKPGIPFETGAEKPGNLKFKDISGADGKPDGKITGFDRTVIGSTLPDFYGAFNTDFTFFKRWNLYLGFQYQYGSQLFNANNLALAVYNNTSSNQLAAWMNRWTADNTTSTQYNNLQNDSVVCDYFIEDSSFLRFKNARLSYTFPSSKLSRANISLLRVYASVDNVCILTKYSGFDPEVSTKMGSGSSSSILTSGFDYGVMPHPRTFTVGVNITFE